MSARTTLPELLSFYEPKDGQAWEAVAIDWSRANPGSRVTIKHLKQYYARMQRVADMDEEPPQDSQEQQPIDATPVANKTGSQARQDFIFAWLEAPVSSSSEPPEGPPPIEGPLPTESPPPTEGPAPIEGLPPIEGPALHLNAGLSQEEGIESLPHNGTLTTQEIVSRFHNLDTYQLENEGLIESEDCPAGMDGRRVYEVKPTASRYVRAADAGAASRTATRRPPRTAPATRADFEDAMDDSDSSDSLLLWENPSDSLLLPESSSDSLLMPEHSSNTRPEGPENPVSRPENLRLTVSATGSDPQRAEVGGNAQDETRIASTRASRTRRLSEVGGNVQDEPRIDNARASRARRLAEVGGNAEDEARIHNARASRTRQLAGVGGNAQGESSIEMVRAIRTRGFVMEWLGRQG